MKNDTHRTSIHFSITVQFHLIHNIVTTLIRIRLIKVFDFNFSTHSSLIIDVDSVNQCPREELVPLIIPQHPDHMVILIGQILKTPPPSCELQLRSG